MLRTGITVHQFLVQRTWTELTEFFLQKTKRKKPKLPYEELDMKIGGGVRSVRKSCGRCDIVVGLCLRLFNKVYTHCCCFVVAMPSLKREAERRGKAAANTGPSTNSEGRANSLAEETDEPARGSGSLHLIISITIIRECQHDELEVVAGDGQVFVPMPCALNALALNKLYDQLT
ncbi:hypothetical protein T4A_5025 [Trichinella pseudospiralis]|uniref:Uncharacterized protein n=1 Tax=Trichinella pseudospiralis TaxID=6337 RepID=A0A0V1ER38_TRIPS|nr:hypothetical protein T4A_5025 [Trichinella pseudospiralis]